MDVVRIQTFTPHRGGGGEKRKHALGAAFATPRAAWSATLDIMSALEQIAAARASSPPRGTRRSHSSHKFRRSAACSPLRGLEQLRATKPQTKNLTRSASVVLLVRMGARGPRRLRAAHRSRRHHVHAPHGLIHGADDFYAFLVRRQIPHVFVSNTGAKGASGVREKFARLAASTSRARRRRSSASLRLPRLKLASSSTRSHAARASLQCWRLRPCLLARAARDGGRLRARRIVGRTYSPRRGRQRMGCACGCTLPIGTRRLCGGLLRRIDTRRCRPSDWRAWPRRLVV